MDLQFTAVIAMPPGDVFAFFRDIDQHAGRKGTRVPVYDKITPGSVGVGTRYREVVQLLPMLRGEIISEITEYDEGKRLGYRFSGLGMTGELTYTFEAVGQGTSVVQKQSLNPRGLLQFFDAAIGKMFSAMAAQRLETIRALLEQSDGEAHYDTRAFL